MRIAKLLLLLAAIVLCRDSFAQSDRNGNWWNGNDRSSKVAYVIGFWDGETEESDVFSITLGLNLPQKYFKEMLEFVAVVTKEAVARSERSRGITAGQMVEGADAFYKDYRNRLIPVRAIFRAVKWSIAGTDEAATEKFLVILRKSAAESAAKETAKETPK